MCSKLFCKAVCDEFSDCMDIFLMYMLGLALAPNLARVINIPIYSGVGTTMFCFDYVHAKMNQI